MLPVIVNGKQIAKDVHKSTKETVTEIKKSTKTGRMEGTFYNEKFFEIILAWLIDCSYFSKNRDTSNT